MFEIFISFWLYTGQTETVAQDVKHKTLEACEAVLPFYHQAANSYVWNDEELQQKVKYVHSTCAKVGTSKEQVLNKIISERFKLN